MGLWMYEWVYGCMNGFMDVWMQEGVGDSVDRWEGIIECARKVWFIKLGCYVLLYTFST